MALGWWSSDDAYKELERLHELRRTARDCADPTGCPDACTGLGAQLAQAKVCTEDLLDAFSEALGRPRPRPAAGETRKPIDIVANYHPDQAPVDESKIDTCLVGVIGFPIVIAQFCTVDDFSLVE
jgi:hypothetical protein